MSHYVSHDFHVCSYKTIGYNNNNVATGYATGYTI